MKSIAIVILIYYFISLTLGQLAPSENYGTNLTFTPSTYFVYWLNPISEDFLDIDYNFTTTATVNLLFNIFDNTTLPSALNSLNCVIPPEYSMVTYIDNYLNITTLTRPVGFSVEFNDTDSITDGSVQFLWVGDETQTYGALLCRNSPFNYIFLDGQFIGGYNILIPNVINNGVYVLVRYDGPATRDRNLLFGQFFDITQSPATYSFQSGFSLIASAKNSSTITVVYNTINPTGIEPQFGLISQHEYYDISHQPGTLIGLNAVLNFPYTTYNKGFKIGHFDFIDSAWSFPNTDTVDTVDKIVSIPTNHFSTWGLYGEPAAANILSPINLLLIIVISIMLL